MREILSSSVDFLNHYGQPFCDFAGKMLVQVTILVLILLALELVLRNRARAVVRYYLWLLVLVKLVLPVGLHTPASVAYWLPTARSQPADTAASRQSSATAAVPAARFANRPNELDRVGASAEQSRTEFAPFDDRRVSDGSAQPARSAPATQPTLDSPRLQWRGVLFGHWIVGVLSLLTLLARRALWVRRIVRQATSASAELHEQLRDCLSALGMSTRVILKTSDRLGSPAICGLWRPTILLPRGFPASLDREQVRLVFVHELVHWRRGDLAVNCLQALLQILYFYNPAVWLANLFIRRLREQAVDETVLVALHGQPDRYAATLLDIAAAPLRPLEATLHLTGVVESRGALALRIRHILARPVPRTAKLGFNGLAAIALNGVLLLPMGHPDPTALASDEPTSKLNESPTGRDQAGSGEHAQPTFAVERGKDIDGDPLPAGAIARLGTKLSRPNREAIGLAFLDDGKSFVQVTNDGWLQHWDPGSGRLVSEKQISNGHFFAASISPGSGLFAVHHAYVDVNREKSSSSIFIFKLSSGNEEKEIELHERFSEGLALSPDGRTLAYSGETVHLVDVATEKEIVIPKIDGRRAALAFSPNGKTLAIGGNEGRLVLWRWSAKEDPRSIETPHDPRFMANPIGTVVFSPDGALLAVNNPGSESFKGILLYDVASGQIVRSMGAGGAVAFSPDGKFLATPINDIRPNLGRGATLWEVSTGKLMQRLRGLFGGASLLAFSPDGQQLTACGSPDSTMCIWNVKMGERSSGYLPGHVQPPNTIRFLAGDREIATAGDDGTLRIWSLVDSSQRRLMEHKGNERAGVSWTWIRAMDVSPDGKYAVSSSSDDTVRLWDIATGREVYRLPGHTWLGSGRLAVHFTPDGKRFASWGGDMRVYVWDVATGKAVHEFQARPAGVDLDLDPMRMGPVFEPVGGFFSADTSALFVALNDVRRFSVRTGEELPKIDYQPGQEAKFALSLDGHYLLAQKWNIQRYKFKNGQSGSATGKTHPVELRALPDGKLIASIDIAGGFPGPAAFSPDANLVAITVADEPPRIELRRVPDLSEVARIELPSRAHAVEFSHSGKLLAASVADSTVIAWDLEHLPPTKKP